LNHSDDISEIFIVKTASNVVGWEALVALAEKHESAGESWAAAKLLVSSSCTNEIEKLGKGSDEIVRLVKRACDLLAKGKQNVQAGSLEFQQRGRLAFHLPWSSKLVLDNSNRMAELVKEGVAFTSARSIYDFAMNNLIYQHLGKFGFTPDGAGNHLVEEYQEFFAKCVQQCAEYSKQAYNQTDNAALKIVSAQCANGLGGSSAACWAFPESYYNLATTYSEERFNFVLETYTFEDFHEVREWK
jgi:hypothetical protein